MPVPPFASILRPDLAELTSYVPHAGDYAVRLDANEAPALLSPEAQATLERALRRTAWSRYPDARMVELRAAIAERCACRPDEVLAGCGSDEVIALLLTALDRPRDRAATTTIVTTSPTFVMYKVSARARGMKVVEVPLDAGWDLQVEAMRRAVEMTRPNVLFIATPNNPTGALMSEDRLQAVIEAAPDALVVIDEAYIDYAPRSQIALRERYPNVAVLRTLSKIGFAALRIGWMIAPADLIAEVDKVRQPYSLNAPAQGAAVAVLRELGPEIDRVVGAVIAERQRVADALAGMGLDVAPSHANFLWVGTRRSGKDVFEALAGRGVLVRSFHAAGGRLRDRLRITIGLPAENDRLIEEIAGCA
jgi:histidinol-phosphate aminotransferase